MKGKGYSICGGSIFKKLEDSTFTSVYASNVKTFLLRSLANDEIANCLSTHINQVTALLSNPACRLITPLEIDFNLIEVLPKGTCFNISSKRFERHDVLQKSPRAFVKYTFDEAAVPYPKPFVEGKR